MDRIIHAHRKLQYNLYNLLARTATLSQMPGTYCDFCGVRFHKTVSEPIWTNLDQSEPAWSLREFRTDSCGCKVKSDIGFDHMHNHGPADDLRSNVAIGVRRTWRAVAWAQILVLGCLGHQALRENYQFMMVYEWCPNCVRTVSLRVPLISFVHRFSVVLAYVSEIVRVYVARCNTAASNFYRGVIWCYLCYLLHHLQ